MANGMRKLKKSKTSFSLGLTNAICSVSVIITYGCYLFITLLSSSHSDNWM